MKKEDVKNLGIGLYKIFWKSGGHSLASVGNMPNGSKWIAPVNWVGGMCTSNRDVWRDVKKVKIIKE